MVLPSITKRQDATLVICNSQPLNKSDTITPQLGNVEIIGFVLPLDFRDRTKIRPSLYFLKNDLQILYKVSHLGVPLCQMS